VVDTSPHLDEDLKLDQGDSSALPAKPVLAASARASEDSLFKALLPKRQPDEPLGLKADVADEVTMHICRVNADDDTPITRYNATAPPAKQIRAGDYFMGVNGLTASSAPAGAKFTDLLRAELLKRDIEVLVSRPQEWDIQVSRKGKSMGLDLNYSNAGASLIIARVCDGLVQQNFPEVCAGDRIVAVDGLDGGPKDLLARIADSPDQVTLTLSRPYSTN